jgi:hypothetical protein
MRKSNLAKEDHFAKTEAQNATAAQAPPQQMLCLVLTPSETDIVFNALGELPAKNSEGLRAKIRSQAEQQTTLLKGLFGEESVKAILAS